MTKNKIEMINGISGRNSHRFLIKESFRIFRNRGYDVEIEHVINGGKRADLFATKNKEKIVIECLIKPNLKTIQKKLENYKGYKIVITYPKHFIPTFPVEDFVDEVLYIELPEFLKKKPKMKTITISNETWVMLNKRRKIGESMNEILTKLSTDKKVRKFIENQK